MTVDTDEFIDNSSLEVLIPEAIDVAIEELCSYKTTNVDNATPPAGRRSLLYFGMHVEQPRVSRSHSFLGPC